jgi:DNA-binding CsgD family transcriptional regulator
MVTDIASAEAVSSQTIDAFSQVVFALHTQVRSSSISAFHQQALLLLGSLIAFDKAWWGRATWNDELPVEHSSFLQGLPKSYATDWDELKVNDRSLSKMHQTQGVCQAIHCTAPDANPSLAELGRHYDLSYALSIVLTEAHTQLGVHLTLFRSHGSPPFTPTEKRLLEWLMPHLIAAEQESYLRTISTLRDSEGAYDETALAVTDRFGVLLSVEPVFLSMLTSEWPGWHGHRLPGQWVPENVYAGHSVRIESQPMGDLFLLRAHRRSAVERLSARELEVAKGFAIGQTYKEIARNIGVSPCTVRHHLRKIYNKLGINRKAQIAQVI